MGKIKVGRVQATIEPDLVYPLLRGKDVWRWSTNPSAQIILANQTDRLAGIPEAEMKQRYPKTYAYLKKFEGDKEQPKRGTLRGRALYKKFYKPSAPFYSMFNVGSYTVSPWKVMWPEVGHTVRASVCGPDRIEFEKAPLPTHTVVAVSCETNQEAHFICALLNSAPAQSLIRGYIVLHPSPHILDNLAIPEYQAENETHLMLAEKSEKCHTAATEMNTQLVATLEGEIDQAAARIWNITSEELRAIRSAL